jgi:hypothetical protein
MGWVRFAKIVLSVRCAFERGRATGFDLTRRTEGPVKPQKDGICADAGYVIRVGRRCY